MWHGTLTPCRYVPYKTTNSNFLLLECFSAHPPSEQRLRARAEHCACPELKEQWKVLSIKHYLVLISASFYQVLMHLLLSTPGNAVTAAGGSSVWWAVPEGVQFRVPNPMEYAEWEKFWSRLLPRWFKLVILPSYIYLSLMFSDCLCSACVTVRRAGVCAEPVLL